MIDMLRAGAQGLPIWTGRTSTHASTRQCLYPRLQVAGDASGGMCWTASRGTILRLVQIKSSLCFRERATI